MNDMEVNFGPFFENSVIISWDNIISVSIDVLIINGNTFAERLYVRTFG